MTLLSRRNRQTTVLTIQGLEKAADNFAVEAGALGNRCASAWKRWLRRAVLAALVGSSVNGTGTVFAQQGWQPTRLTPQQHQAAAGQVPIKKRSPVFEDDQTAKRQNVVIRWKDTGQQNIRSNGTPSNGPNTQAVSRASSNGLSYGQVFQEPASNARQQRSYSQSGAVRTASTGSNPLRTNSSRYSGSGTYSRSNTVHGQSAVQTAAAYQQGPGNQPFDPFGDDANGGFPDVPNNLQQGNNQNDGGFPAFPPDNGMPAQPQDNGFPSQPQNNGLNPGLQDPYALGDPQDQGGQAEIENGGADPLNLPEVAPNPIQDSGPSDILEQGSDNNPFPGAESESGSASDQYSFDDDDNGLELPDQRDRQANSLSCNDLRDRFLNRPLSVVKLNTSPKFGIGLRGVKNDTEDERLKFAQESKVRDWRNNAGELVTSGRLIDLKNDRVILDVYGENKEIPLHDLSDRDLAYVGEKWNIPLKCGTGNIPYEGRSHVHSVVQWKAPGHCHKPLYFEQPQLERYGHTAGPVLQPLISSAHFFTNISILPYKMGIHPPNECQYSLGYYRPGNCAPYMMQPFPWSLRGAATQAGAVVGVGALVP